MFSRAKLLELSGLVVFALLFTVTRFPSQSVAASSGQKPILKPGPGPGTRPYSPPLNDSYNGSSPSSETLEYSYILDRIKKGAAALEKHLGERLPKTRQLLQQIQTDTAFLQQKWLMWSQANPRTRLYGGSLHSDLYYQSLVANDNQLRSLLKADNKSAALNDLASEINARTEKQMVDGVKAVADDIHTKAENCRLSKDGLGKTVKVLVRTFDQTRTNEISGCEIYYVSVAKWILNGERPPSRPSRFKKFSSPAVENNFAPGNYMMWIKTRNGRSTEEHCRIGGDGNPEFPLQLHE